MTNFTAICGFFLMFFSYQLEAQSVVVSDTISGTPLTLTMDSRINDLMAKQEENCTRTISSDSGRETYNPSRVVVKDRPMSDAEICRKNPKIMGFKIQVAVAKTNVDAKNIGLNFRRRFPNLKVEVDASLRPNYKVMAGSYFTRQSAASDLSRVKSAFPDAIAVPYRVFCVEAK